MTELGVNEVLCGVELVYVLFTGSLVQRCFRVSFTKPHNIEIFLILWPLSARFGLCIFVLLLCVMKKRRSPAPGTNERMEATAFLSEITNTIL